MQRRLIRKSQLLRRVSLVWCVLRINLNLRTCWWHRRRDHWQKFAVISIQSADPKWSLAGAFRRANLWVSWSSSSILANKHINGEEEIVAAINSQQVEFLFHSLIERTSETIIVPWKRAVFSALVDVKFTTCLLRKYLIIILRGIPQLQWIAANNRYNRPSWIEFFRGYVKVVAIKVNCCCVEINSSVIFSKGTLHGDKELRVKWSCWYKAETSPSSIQYSR